MLNRIMGGRDAAKLAGLVGVDKIMKRREVTTSPTGVND